MASGGVGVARLAELLRSLPDETRAQVVAHASWVSTRADAYERLAFLGDSVLGLALADRIYADHPGAGAGGLTRIFGQAVSGRACAAVGFELGLDQELLAREPVGQEGHHAAAELVCSERVMASVCEAAIGACYLARGYDAVAPAIVEAFAEHVAAAVTQPVDFKSALQEDLARAGLKVHYEVLGTDGPPHQRVFEVAALVGTEQVGTGRGTSKKAAEQDAAEQALSARKGGS